MDFYGDDIDSLLRQDDVDDLNENIRDENVDEENDEDGEKKADSEPVKVEPKKRAVRNPQIRLNVERLKSDRGIHTLEKYFTDIKYKGKGYERDDLNNIMKRLEHWAHRLYPSYTFDDFVDTVEKLGKKKTMQTHMYRYRHDMLEDTSKPKPSADDDEDGADKEVTATREDDPIDELDEIIEQQIQNYSHMAPKTPAHDTTFDSIRSSMIASPRLQKQMPVVASTPIAASKPLDAEEKNPSATLTSEQMAKIAENRRLAKERLLQKQAEMRQKAIEEDI